jgi:hypothetical protein
MQGMPSADGVPRDGMTTGEEREMSRHRGKQMRQMASPGLTATVGGALLAGAIAAIVLVLGASTPASGATGLAPCGSGEHAGILSVTGQEYTCTYDKAGEEAFNLPPGASRTVAIMAVGAPGGHGGDYSGGSNGPAGGAGAVVQAPALTLMSGLETLYVEVGGIGGNGVGCAPGAGGQNGGGVAGDSRCNDGAGGGGGGASDIRATPASEGGLSAAAGDPRLIVAAGGGGGGGAIVSPGGAGGSAGDSAVSGAGGGGQADCEGSLAQGGGLGGIDAGGGLGGQEPEPMFCTQPGGGAGTAGAGGGGASGNIENSAGGGGGGGGYVGGGGGAYGDGGGGGGGGASYGPAGTIFEAAQSSQQAEVAITYTMPANTVNTTTTVSSSTMQTLTETLTAAAPKPESQTPSNRQTHASSDGFAFTLTVPSGCFAPSSTLDADVSRSGLPPNFIVLGYSYRIGSTLVLRRSVRFAHQPHGRITAFIPLRGVRPGTYELLIRALLARAGTSHAIPASSPTLMLRFTVCG